MIIQFERNVLSKNGCVWNESVHEEINFKYNEIYHDENVTIIEDDTRMILLKIYHANETSCCVEISIGDDEFKLLYKNGRIVQINIEEKNVKPITEYNGCSKIAIVCLATSNMKDMTAVSRKNHTFYAKKHNYTYLFYPDSIVQQNYVTWNKVFVLKEVLENFDYVMWIDADAIFTNTDITIESILAVKNKNMHICDDIGGWRVNTGVMIWKNDPWSLKTVADWSQMIKIPHSQGAEQAQLIEYLRKNDPECENWCLHPRKTFNSHPKEHNKGDFVLHMMGLSGEERIETFLKWNTMLHVA